MTRISPQPVSLEDLTEAVRAGGAHVVVQSSDSVRQTARLSGPERNRAACFRHPEDRRSFEAGRIIVRSVLEGFTPRVELRVAAHRKPECPAEGAPAFSISHTGNWIAVALGFTSELGVDIEWTGRPLRSTERLARRFYSESERSQLAAGVGFLDIWTRKEAYLKAKGTGLSVKLTEVDTTGLDGLHDFRVAEDIRGAVYAPGEDITWWRLE